VDTKKLSEQNFAEIRDRKAQAINHVNSLTAGERFRTTIPARETDSDVVISNSLHDVSALLDHIDAMEAEYRAGMQRAIDDAFRQAEATSAFMNEQTARIGELEQEVERKAGYAAFLYSCAKCGEQPETYEWYLNRNNTDKANTPE